MSEIILDGLYQVEGINDQLADVRAKIEERINLNIYTNNIRPVVVPMTTVMRTCALVGLSDPKERNIEKIKSYTLSWNGVHFPASMFAKPMIKKVFRTLIKMRYSMFDIDLGVPGKYCSHHEL